jgi:L-fuculose-phosphate aldolase
MLKACRRPIATDPAIERAMVRIGRAMHRAGFVAGTAGNLSVRLPDGLVLATPSGLAKGRLAARDLIVVDGDGEVVRGRPGLAPTSEMPMHLEVYRRRPDVNAVVHAHPVHAVALSLTGDELQRSTIPEAVATFGSIAVTPYSPPSSRENADAITDAIGGHDVIVLARHGSLTVGATLEEAYRRLEVLEHTARILAVARSLGPVPSLTDAEVEDLLRRGRAYRRR